MRISSSGYGGGRVVSCHMPSVGRGGKVARFGWHVSHINISHISHTATHLYSLYKYAYTHTHMDLPGRYHLQSSTRAPGSCSARTRAHRTPPGCCCHHLHVCAGRRGRVSMSKEEANRGCHTSLSRIFYCTKSTHLSKFSGVSSMTAAKLTELSSSTKAASKYMVILASAHTKWDWDLTKQRNASLHVFGARAAAWRNRN